MFNHKVLARQSRNQKRAILHHEALSAAKPQPKKKTNFTTKVTKSTK
jgi:hypothetical protein